VSPRPTNAERRARPVLPKAPVKPDPIFGARPRHELQFLPAALEVIDTPPPPLPRVAALALVGLLLVVVAWSVLGKVDIVSTAPGRIVPAGGSKVVQPLEAGTVTAIMVRDGDPVRKGDVLVTLEPTATLADQARVSGELSGQQLDAARLRAVALGEPFRAPQGSDPEAISIARREADAEIADRQAKLQGLRDQIAEHQASLAGAKAEVDRLNALLPLAQQRSKVYQALNAQGFSSSLQLIEAKEKEADIRMSLEVQQRKIPELEAQIATAERAEAEAAADAAKTSLSALAETQVKAASLSEDLAKAADRLKGRTLTAPVDGTVQELAIHTIGGVVGPGQTLMRIAPASGPVEVEARLANKDIGFVRAGMPAEIKVQTFPFTRYGLIKAVVTNVSRDAVTDPRAPEAAGGAAPQGQASGEDLHYLMRLKLERDTMNIDGKPVRLTPGMEVTAEVRTGRRRVVDYVLSPLARATREAGRER
jgi:hemolysin D